jgi:serine/threonine-protein kinase
VRRFFREARAATQVGHENVIEIFDFVEEGDHKYFVMELLRGEPLSKVMIREKVLPISRTLHIMIQTADALAAVHAAGIIHRDLKPDNIFLTERAKQKDFVKLYDFGVAKLLTLEDNTQPTQQGMLLGTPAYMSPEQLQGNPIDGRADIYALGVILFMMLTGRRPYKGKTLPELMLRVCHDPVPAPSSLPNLPHRIPEPLESLVLRCMAKRPEDRLQTMAEVRDALRAIETRVDGSTQVLETPFDPAAIAKIEALTTPHPSSLGGRHPATPVGMLPTPSLQLQQPPPPVPPRSRRWLALIGVGALGLAALVAGWLLLGRSDGAQAVTAADASAASAPATVEIEFASAPTGAQVRQVGAEQPLGVTPLRATLDRGADSRQFMFALAGHRSTTLVVPVDRDGRVLATLVEEPAAPASHPEVAPTRVGAERKARPHRKSPGDGEKKKAKESLVDPFQLK